MRPHVLLIRAIGSEFLRRKLVPLVIGGLVVGSICTLGSILLVSLVSRWWILLLIAVFLVEIFVFAALIGAFIILRAIRPAITKTQRTAVESFVDKLERVADSIGTPKILILFWVVKDVVRPRGRTFIQRVVSDSTTLKSDYQSLQKQFTA